MFFYRICCFINLPREDLSKTWEPMVDEEMESGKGRSSGYPTHPLHPLKAQCLFSLHPKKMSPCGPYASLPSLWFSLLITPKLGHCNKDFFISSLFPSLCLTFSFFLSLSLSFSFSLFLPFFSQSLICISFNLQVVYMALTWKRNTTNIPLIEATLLQSKNTHNLKSWRSTEIPNLSQISKFYSL